MWLHGFTQTQRSAHEFRSILAGTYEVLTIDLPGHGQNASISASLEETADQLARALPAEPFILGGYSFGGRVALHFTLRHPERLSRLVLLGATRGIADPVERAQRRERDNALADHIEEVGASAFLDEWLALPMFASLPSDPTERATRSVDPHGLAMSLRLAGTGTQTWLGGALGEVVVPTLALAGALDEKFSREARAIAGTVRHGAAMLIPRAGHAAHLEQPAATAALVSGVQPQ